MKYSEHCTLSNVILYLKKKLPKTLKKEKKIISYIFLIQILGRIKYSITSLWYTLYLYGGECKCLTLAVLKNKLMTYILVKWLFHSQHWVVNKPPWNCLWVKHLPSSMEITALCTIIGMYYCECVCEVCDLFLCGHLLLFDNSILLQVFIIDTLQKGTLCKVLYFMSIYCRLI